MDKTYLLYTNTELKTFEDYLFNLYFKLVANGV